MPVEYDLLNLEPYLFQKCPECKVEFKPFMRGLVQRPRRFLGIFWRRKYCAVICGHCKKIIGWESPATKEVFLRKKDWRVVVAHNFKKGERYVGRIL